jgi:hypothetical protein
MNKSGVLVYKCRRCSNLIKNTSVPEGLNALLDITIEAGTRKEWGSGATLLDTHLCEDGGIGVSDLIGFESDAMIEQEKMIRHQAKIIKEEHDKRMSELRKQGL